MVHSALWLVPLIRLWIGVTLIGLVVLALAANSWGVITSCEIDKIESVSGRFPTPQLKKARRDYLWASHTLILACSAIVALVIMLIVTA